MKFAGRVQAAIEVLNEVLTRHRPAAEALKDWGKAHRFAGSGDRHAIGTLVYDSLRQRSVLAVQGGGDSARQVVLGLLRRSWNMSVDEIAALADGQHGPSVITAEEERALSSKLSSLAWHIEANVPAWLAPVFEELFGPAAATEGQALSQRAPIDLRTNLLKCDRKKLQDHLAAFHAEEGPWVNTSLRIPAPVGEQKHINLEVDVSHGLGFFEVQDTASQIAAALTGVKPGEHVADICAGAGGKTLALAALMKNQGRLVAHDVDRHRLRPIFERVMRAGATCVEVVSADQASTLKNESFDCVVVDAPCSGTGTWRRKPEIKWKLSPKTLETRLIEQRSVLENGAKLVRKGGRLVYFTCSILPQENVAQVKQFLTTHSDFKVIPYAEQWAQTIGGEAPLSADGSKETLVLTPRQHGVDGFFVAVLQRA